MFSDNQPIGTDPTLYDAFGTQNTQIYGSCIGLIGGPGCMNNSSQYYQEGTSATLVDVEPGNSNWNTATGASNFTTENGSCSYYGCNDPEALNYFCILNPTLCTNITADFDNPGGSITTGVGCDTAAIANASGVDSCLDNQFGELLPGNSASTPFDCEYNIVSPTYDCDPITGCFDPGTGNGQYSSISSCLSNCSFDCSDVKAVKCGNPYSQPGGQQAVYDFSCITIDGSLPALGTNDRFLLPNIPPDGPVPVGPVVSEQIKVKSKYPDSIDKALYTPNQNAGTCYEVVMVNPSAIGNQTDYPSCVCPDPTFPPTYDCCTYATCPGTFQLNYGPGSDWAIANPGLSTPSVDPNFKFCQERLDGSGEFSTLTDCTLDCEEIYGCTDPLATNYDPLATIDDGNCEYEGAGCQCCVFVEKTITLSPITINTWCFGTLGYPGGGFGAAPCQYSLGDVVTSQVFEHQDFSANPTCEDNNTIQPVDPPSVGDITMCTTHPSQPGGWTWDCNDNLITGLPKKKPTDTNTNIDVDTVEPRDLTTEPTGSADVPERPTITPDTPEITESKKLRKLIKKWRKNNL